MLNRLSNTFESQVAHEMLPLISNIKSASFFKKTTKQNSFPVVGHLPCNKSCKAKYPCSCGDVRTPRFLAMASSVSWPVQYLTGPGII